MLRFRRKRYFIRGIPFKLPRNPVNNRFLSGICHGFALGLCQYLVTQPDFTTRSNISINLMSGDPMQLVNNNGHVAYNPSNKAGYIISFRLIIIDPTGQVQIAPRINATIGSGQHSMVGLDQGFLATNNNGAFNLYINPSFIGNSNFAMRSCCHNGEYYFIPHATTQEQGLQHGAAQDYLNNLQDPEFLQNVTGTIYSEIRGLYIVRMYRVL